MSAPFRSKKFLIYTIGSDGVVDIRGEDSLKEVPVGCEYRFTNNTTGKTHESPGFAAALQRSTLPNLPTTRRK